MIWRKWFCIGSKHCEYISEYDDINQKQAILSWISKYIEAYYLKLNALYLLQSPPKGITVPYRPLKPVTVATNLGPQHAAVVNAVNNPAVSAGSFLPVSHATAGHYTAAAAAAASLNPATANAAHAALIPASAQVCLISISINFIFYCYLFSVSDKRCHNPLPPFIN